MSEGGGVLSELQFWQWAMTSESELELLVASTDSMCACILTPLGGWSDCVLTCACACVCVCVFAVL